MRTGRIGRRGQGGGRKQRAGGGNGNKNIPPLYGEGGEGRAPRDGWGLSSNQRMSGDCHFVPHRVGRFAPIHPPHKGEGVRKGGSSLLVWPSAYRRRPPTQSSGI